jgi:transcriptional regulator with XRE-family HTH domain
MKPARRDYPKSLKTIGDHIRKRRLDLGLLQREVAARIGVDQTTIYNWEGNATTPILRYYKPIEQFLGYNPFPRGRTLAERLVQHRKACGLSQRLFAKQLGIDSGTLGKWERGERHPTGRFLALIESFL